MTYIYFFFQEIWMKSGWDQYGDSWGEDSRLLLSCGPLCVAFIFQSHFSVQDGCQNSGHSSEQEGQSHFFFFFSFFFLILFAGERGAAGGGRVERPKKKKNVQARQFRQKSTHGRRRGRGRVSASNLFLVLIQFQAISCFLQKCYSIISSFRSFQIPIKVSIHSVCLIFQLAFSNCACKNIYYGISKEPYLDNFRLKSPLVYFPQLSK